MHFGSAPNSKPNSLMDEYAALLSDAVLRHRARVAEHTARLEAELASKVKSEFIANMSHELKTPLNTVIGFSKLLTQHEHKRLGDQEIVEYATLINSAAGQLLAIINDILDISKLQSGKLALDTKVLDLEIVLTDILATIQKQARDSNLSLRIALSPDLPFVRADNTKLKQVFSNLLSNALKFTPEGGTISVNATTTDDGDARVVIADTGVGMTSEEVQLALMPFGQADGSRTRWREGAGLGLPIAHALVELHGGALEIRSQKGSGTEVVISIPNKDKNIQSAAVKSTGARNSTT
ncbi:sensor histidine kinase [Hyphomicrobium methylovorum]|uniref:sensor histidine kinase n=1 Tax=Hyphomicrobium methylovorum TaxID=84 RepID=UPI0015E76369|nr:HAMP domain-containing sensor histidine kinase [Hyphomicrobium methylovorum]MBA2126595.1 sensor histidine kinase [Hyphomicrobium methylovorum]